MGLFNIPSGAFGPVVKVQDLHSKELDIFHLTVELLMLRDECSVMVFLVLSMLNFGA